ncbi:MAG TPA: WYL domain-containing protein [Dermatophilaceae bacterium]|nr:WYL domain-containing protein [Dermatophilaceae bacterium]
MSAKSAPGMESATSRLTRLLAMVPWLLNRQGVDIGEAAREFGVSPAQVEADLQLLFVCGTPGHLPDDLIEADWEDGRVYLGNADTIARPLRLGVDEALALIVGLRALAAVPELAGHEAIARALTKLEQATGSRADASARIQYALDGYTGQDMLTMAQRALVGHRRVHLSYLVPGRDEATERDVDPMRVVNLDGQWYLEGWCHRAQATRLFRFDRIDRLTVLDRDGTPPPDAAPRDLGSGLYRPAEDDIGVRLLLRRGSTWVSDYYPVESLLRLPDGSQEVVLRTPDTAWVRRLVWRLGGGATVLEPEALAQEVVRGAVAALARYEG